MNKLHIENFNYSEISREPKITENNKFYISYFKNSIINNNNLYNSGSKQGTTYNDNKDTNKLFSIKDAISPKKGF